MRILRLMSRHGVGMMKINKINRSHYQFVYPCMAGESVTYEVRYNPSYKMWYLTGDGMVSPRLAESSKLQELYVYPRYEALIAEVEAGADWTIPELKMIFSYIFNSQNKDDWLVEQYKQQLRAPEHAD